MPWMPSCGAMRRSSMLNRVGDFGQRADSANRPPIAVTTISKVAVDQPMTECRGPQCIGLVAAADRNAGAKTTVGRSEQPRAGGQAEEPLDRSWFLLGIGNGFDVRWRIGRDLRASGAAMGLMGKAAHAGFYPSNGIFSSVIYTSFPCLSEKLWYCLHCSLQCNIG